MRTYNFHTMIGDRKFWVPMRAATAREAAADLRATLRDGETIVGWR